MPSLENNLHYVASLIEFTARKTKNRVCEVTSKLGKEGLEHQLQVAEVNHCLSFGQVSDELIEDFGISEGEFDLLSSSQFKVPSHTAIGKVYRNLVLDVLKEGDNVAEVFFEVLTSFISDEISFFDSGVYFENRSYIMHSYLQGRLLD
ncbi:MAG: hypothetical protein FWF59_09740 [Turicibacter sp.]|nr:hypothetical protein [Turicibacter sp.]